MKKAGTLKIKTPSNFRGKFEEKLDQLDICTNPFGKKLPLNIDKKNVKKDFENALFFKSF